MFFGVIRLQKDYFGKDLNLKNGGTPTIVGTTLGYYIRLIRYDTRSTKNFVPRT